MPWKPPVNRAAYKKRYGSRCFLDPKRLSYPVCTRGKLDCRSLRGAQYYANLNKNRAVSRKIKQLRKKC